MPSFKLLVKVDKDARCLAVHEPFFHQFLDEIKIGGDSFGPVIIAIYIDFMIGEVKFFAIHFSQFFHEDIIDQ